MVVLPGLPYFSETGQVRICHQLKLGSKEVKLQQDFCLNSIKHFELQQTTQPNLKVVLRSHLELKSSITGKAFITETAF